METKSGNNAPPADLAISQSPTDLKELLGTIESRKTALASTIAQLDINKAKLTADLAQLEEVRANTVEALARHDQILQLLSDPMPAERRKSDAPDALAPAPPEPRNGKRGSVPDGIRAFLNAHPGPRTIEEIHAALGPGRTLDATRQVLYIMRQQKIVVIEGNGPNRRYQLRQPRRTAVAPGVSLVRPKSNGGAKLAGHTLNGATNGYKLPSNVVPGGQLAAVLQTLAKSKTALPAAEIQKLTGISEPTQVYGVLTRGCSGRLIRRHGERGSYTYELAAR